MKKIVVLGSTGTIGRGVLDIVRAYSQDFRIVGLSTNTNIELLHKQ
ncbi:MAG: 1-deoxy-D-xylulose-5-phosphate reductoisomerase, partial [bacterium]|nr:1-deoxy-D-xylulose-5-phosphate reductoisomerase [bacterium]